MVEVGIRAVSADRRFMVAVEREPLAYMIATAHAANQMETGGVLIGFIDANGQAVIREATGKPRGSQFTWRTFLRKTDGLAALLKSRWSKNEHYLGEWHSHPGGSPSPSAQDIATMKGISLDPKYYCSEPILIIVGTRHGTAELSIHVFPKGVSELVLRTE